MSISSDPISSVPISAERLLTIALISGAVGFYDVRPAVTTSRNFTDQQQFSTFQPAGNIGRSPDGASGNFDVTRAPTVSRNFTDQQQFAFVTPALPLAVGSGGSAFYDRVTVSLARNLTDAQQHAFLTARGNVPTETQVGWQVASPELIQRTVVSEAGQTWPPKEPTAAATATFVPNLEDFVVISRLVLGEVELPVFQIPVAGTGVWWPPLAEAKRRPLARDSFEVIGSFTAPTVLGWQQPFVVAGRQGRQILSVEVLPLPSAVVEVPQGGWLQPLAETRRRQLERDSFEVIATPAATQPQGWAVDQPALRARRQGVAQDAPFVAAPFVLARGADVSVDEVLRTRLLTSTALRSFEVLPVFQVPVAGTGVWWPPLAEARGRPFKAALQVHAYFQPQGTITDASVSSIGWQTASPEYAQRTFVNEHDVWQATTPTVDATPSMAWAIAGDLPPRKPRPVRHSPVFGLSAFLQQIVEPTISIIWQRPRGVAYQQFTTFQPQGDIVSTTPQGWWQPFAEARKKPAPAAVRPFDAWTGYQVPTFQVPGWWQPLDVRFTRPLRASLQAHAFFQPAGDIATTLAGSLGWNSYSPEVFVGRVILEQQGWPPTTPPAIVATPTLGWVGFDQPPRRFRKIKSLSSFAVLSDETPFVDTVFAVVWKRPLNAAQVIFASFNPQGDIISTTPQGWWQPFATARVPARALRPEQFWVGYQIPVPGTGVWWPPLDIRYVRPVKASLQQHDAYQDFIPATQAGLGPFGWSYYFDAGKRPRDAARTPYDFVTLTQVSSLAPQGGWQPTGFDPARPFRRSDLGVTAASLFVQAQVSLAWLPAELARLPRAQRLALDPLAVLTPFTVTATFGWQPTDALVLHARRSVAGDPWSALVTPRVEANFGWQPSFADLRAVRRSGDRGFVSAGLPAQSNTTTSGWHPSAWLDPRFRFRKDLPAGFNVLQIFGFVDNTTTKGWYPTAWIDPRFHYGCAAKLQAFDFHVGRQIPITVTIFAQPTLLGTDAQPTLLGTDDTPTLSGVYGGVTLKGTVA